MNNQLSSISTQYRKFSKGQYVEHTQFNEFLDFFEDQDRLSRVMLQGVGVVCGFQPKLIYTNNKVSSILLSQGIAITTDGDLLTLNNKTRTKKISYDSSVNELKTIDFTGNQYTHWKLYDNYSAMYPAFYNADDQIELWELATAADATKGYQPLASLGSFEDKYLLLYLEAYEKEVRPCRGVDCDNHGVQQIQNLKVLVTNLAGITKILNQDGVYPHPLFLNLIGGNKLKRVILNPVNQSPESLRLAYKNILTQSNYISMFNNLDIVSGVMNITTVEKDDFIEAINDLADHTENFQYAYGVLKDLTDTYTEIAEILPKAFTKAMPDLNSFPKHIMLGKLILNTKLDSTRHQFYNSPVLDNDKTVERLRLLIDRFNMQTQQFKDPSEIAAEKGIKITPSKDISPLGNKAIPFYYDLTETFIDTWEFDKTKNRTSNTNLSFDTSLLSGALHIQNPVRYTIDTKSFYRIEGHHGVNYKDAVIDIRQIKDEKQLGFDVMALSLEQLRGNKDVSKAYFTDYVKKHPGLEYLGGVKRGGTFIIVYESEDNPEVIADFAIPYVCCTPKSDVALSLPATTICRDAAPIMFTITPSNGVVKADVSGNRIGGVQKINGQYMFNPQLVEDVLLDNEIGFTVNDKPTNCTITVLSDLATNIYAQNFIYPSSDTSNTIVTFNVSNPNDEYDYKWDFLNNGKHLSIKPDYQGNVKYSYSSIDATKPVSVLISGNGCSQNIILSDWYTPKPIENTGPTILSLTTDITGGVYWPDNEATLYSSVAKGTGTINGYLWTCTNNNVSFASANSAISGVTFPSAGTYTIKFTVTDTNNLEDTDSITITVGTKASITGVTINLQYPTLNDEIIAQAIVSNPSNISGLKYKWYLNGVFEAETTSTTRSFGYLRLDEQVIGVSISESLGNNHLGDPHYISFTVFERAAGGTSFLGGTLITMADGSKRNVEQIKFGDSLKSSTGVVKVIDVINYFTDEDVYQLNDEEPFITGTHPVKTNKGWASFEPEKTKAIIPSIQVSQLQVGDTLFKENNQTATLSKAIPIKMSSRAYNINVDGSKEFFANGYLVYSEF